MLSETLFRVSREPGLHVLQRRGDRGARELTSSRLCLRAGERATYACPGEETIVVLQQGRGTFATPDLDASSLPLWCLRGTSLRDVPAVRTSRSP